MPVTVALLPPASPDSPAGHEEDEPQEEPDYSGLLRSFDDAADWDDAAPEGLESGVTVAEVDSAGASEEDTQVLDIGDTLGERIAVESIGADDDATGPMAGSDHPSIDEGEVFDADDGEGVLDPMDAVLGGDLPALDAGSDGEEELGDEPALLASLGEEPPPPAERQWVAVPKVTASGPRSVLVQIGARTIAAGKDVLEWRDDGTARVLVPDIDSTIAGIVSCPGTGTLLLATQSGVLLRAEPATAGAAVPVLAWRDAGAIARTTPLSLSIGGPTPSSRPALLLHVRDVGALLESTDQGVTFRRVDLGGRVLVLGIGVPPLCVVETDGARRLLRSEPSGGFAAVGREWPREADPVAICADGDVAALLDGARSIHVSCDAGSTFRRAEHCIGGTAIAVGHVGGNPCAFAALLDPSEMRSVIVLIDARSAEAQTIAYIDITSYEEDDNDDGARVSSLAWDEHTGTLWAAGGFGMKRFRSPPSA